MVGGVRGGAEAVGIMIVMMITVPDDHDQHGRAPEAGFRPLPAPRWGRGRHPTGTEARGSSERQGAEFLPTRVSQQSRGCRRLYLDLRLTSAPAASSRCSSS